MSQFVYVFVSIFVSLTKAQKAKNARDTSHSIGSEHEEAGPSPGAAHFGILIVSIITDVSCFGPFGRRPDDHSPLSPLTRSLL